ncbi:MAG: glycoside hydrolase family 3 C-terminal domain-containing protein [Rhizomicrobium sp.]
MRMFAKAALATAFLAIAAALPAARAQDAAAPQPWMNTALSPDARAALVLAAMTQDEKLQLVNGYFGISLPGMPLPPGVAAADLPSVSGYIAGIPRLGIPAIKESDAGIGIANQLHLRKGDQATALPSGLLTAATWNPDIAFAAGSVLGEEARDRGYNVVLGGAMNLAREPRGGRTFEYAGEDPLLAGTIVGEEIRGIQAQGVITTAKHYALNDQETARTALSARIDWAAARESDLLAFEIALEHGHPGAIMCSYNKINGVYGCENPYILTKVLKQDWGYPGWVMSDWGAVHSTVASANAGLDQESAWIADGQDFFGAPLGKALADGQIPQARLDDMARRIVRSLFAAGLVDHPLTVKPTDLKAHAVTVQDDAEQGIVLLKNDGVLPLPGRAKRIAVIGGYADRGVLSGGGSSQVVPVGNTPDSEVPLSGRILQFPGLGLIRMPAIMLSPPSPLARIAALAPQARVRYEQGDDIAKAVALARNSDVVVVFAVQWMTEGEDVRDLSLHEHQDELIAALAAANPHVVVVLETGGPVLMPWLSSVSAVVETWYAGNSGSAAIANVLFGKVDPAGRLPITFPASEDQLPRPQIPGAGIVSDPFQPSKPPAGLEVDYREGANVGYRWFAQQNQKPLFPFGFGLSYTSFALRDLSVSGGAVLTVHFTIANTGKRAGWQTAQVYATPPASGAVARLVGWTKVMLKPGEKRDVSVTADLRTIAAFDDAADLWRIAGGGYRVAVGTSSADLALVGTATLDAATLKP